MKKTLFAALVSVLIIYTVSCTKETSFTAPASSNNFTNSPAPRLSKLYVLDTTLTAPNDTVSRYTYLYDATDRLTKIITFTIDANGDSSEYRTQDFSYIGTDTVCNLAIRRTRYFSGGVGTNYKDTTFYRYNSSGKQIKDSSRENASSLWSDNYTHLAPDYIKGTYFHLYPGGTYYKGTYAFHPIKINGNIVSQKDTNTIIPSVMLTDTTYFTYNRTMTYNTHPDPLSKVYACTKKEFINGLPSLGGLSCPANLMVSRDDISTRYSNSPPFPTPYDNSHVDYSYVYRADGYPSIAREHYIQSGVTGSSNTYAKILFYY